MTRRAVAVILLPMPAFVWWSARQPLGTLPALLAGLLGVADTATGALLLPCPLVAPPTVPTDDNSDRDSWHAHPLQVLAAVWGSTWTDDLLG